MSAWIGSWVSSQELPYHSRSLYMIVKKTWRNRLTAFMTTAKRYNHASPDMLATVKLPNGRYGSRLRRWIDRFRERRE